MAQNSWSALFSNQSWLSDLKRRHRGWSLNPDYAVLVNSTFRLVEPWKFAQTWIPPYGNAQTLHKPITNSLPQPNFFDGIAFAAMLAKYKFNAAQKHLDPVWPFLLSCFCLCPTWFSISIFLGISGSSDAVSSVGSGSAASQLNQLGTSSSSSMSKQIISQLQQDAANLSKMTGSNSSLAGIWLETESASSDQWV